MIRRFYTLALLVTATLATGSPCRGEALVLGLVANDSAQHIAEAQPLANEVAKLLGEKRYTSAEVKVFPFIDLLGEALKKGQIHIVVGTAFAVLQLEADKQVRILARHWKGGKSSYRSVIFVKVASGVQTLANLLGQKIAFEDPNSTSSYFLPRAMIEAAGLKISLVPNPTMKATPGKVNYTFAGGENEVARMVLAERVQAGAFSDKDFADLPEAARNELRVIATSEEFPRSLLAVASQVPSPLAEAIASVVTNMHTNESGKAALLAFAGTTKFDRVDQDPKIMDYARKLVLTGVKK